ncbi:Hydroxymethylglutaryl-CoA lyase [Carex littledalei]|uniref:hydroxymethylglutaryl-CoA lyase n=1 Tax=Carex littledalei TaxID=544730 RepID=A0A833QZA4_9POAL|nr:Hydroxymethylglutaryl-CoA lyase [Carex littledalei]
MNNLADPFFSVNYKMSSLEEPLGLQNLPKLSINRLHDFNSNSYMPVLSRMEMGSCYLESNEESALRRNQSDAYNNSCNGNTKSLNTATPRKEDEFRNLPYKIITCWPQFVKVVEVGARDGLQNEKPIIPTSVKIELIKKLVYSGLFFVEATSFVSPKWIPQLADAKDVMEGIKHINDARFPVLTPNIRGFKDAIAAGAREIGIFASASESFSKLNINCTIEDSLFRYREVALAAKKNGITIRG